MVLLNSAKKAILFLLRQTILLRQTDLEKKLSHLARSEILGLLINTFTTDDKYFCHKRKNLPLPIQMQLSKKPVAFSCIIGIHIEF